MTQDLWTVVLTEAGCRITDGSGVSHTYANHAWTAEALAREMGRSAKLEGKLKELHQAIRLLPETGETEQVRISLLESLEESNVPF